MPNCADAGVLGVLPGVVGAMQATEAIKLIVGAGEPLSGRLLVYDALQVDVREPREFEAGHLEGGMLAWVAEVDPTLVVAAAR